MKANEETIRQLRKEQEELTNKAFEAQEQAEHSRNEVRRLEKKDIHLRAEIHSLNTNKSNKTCVFGQQAMQAHDFIRREFNSDDHINLPRGPIAKYISVPNPQYRDLIEHELTHSLRSFIVNSDEDRRKLRSIFERVYTTGHLPSIISSPFSDHVYDVSPYKVKKIENTSVLIDEIKCDDPIVMNFLIDWCRIETVLITESKETAEYLTSDSENVPPNLTRVLVPNLYLEYIPAPHYSMYSLNLLSARLLQVDINDRIRLLEKDTVDVKRSLLNAQIVFQKTNGLTINFKKEIKAKAPVIEQLSNENIKALEEIMEIEQYEYEELPEQDHLQKTMDSIRAKMSETERQHRLLLADLSEINEQKAQAEKQEAEERAKIIPIQENIESIEKEYLDIESKIRSLDTHYEANFVKLNKTIELHENFLKQKADVERDLKEARDKAQKRGDCCEIENTEQEIRDKICHYKAKIKQFENYNGSVEKVQQKLNQLRTKLQSQTENLQLAREAAKKLRISYHQRAQRYQRCRFHFFSMVDFQFQQALSLREFKSNVIIDHGANTMQIDVEPPSGNKTSNSKTLSGGERSFTTVSLLKGLWSTSDHPFYFLDEYDVFTDEINRSFITQILIDEGNDYQNRQFCFLTPQDTEVAASPLIKVHKYVNLICTSQLMNVYN
ncbi:structural maintenance of chromosomes protein 6-like isoform X2 [Scaptodrosophila lebanonensis]|uniref:Structural maintenance of chromosomes protein 6-like isoform X2 n=1 Tax=Drosophila lebanonensis TaxID=7225 RepID=A0A6J2THC2_DROLE|nr:structural maintenance of chromosomes protein 6-like isoform X2 [Scaptodrosophila lebanonensis]